MVELKKFIAEFQNRSQFKGRIIIGGGALSKDFSMTDFNSNVVLQPISKFDSSTVSLWHFD